VTGTSSSTKRRTSAVAVAAAAGRRRLRPRRPRPRRRHLPAHLRPPCLAQAGRDLTSQAAGWVPLRRPLRASHPAWFEYPGRPRWSTSCPSCGAGSAMACGWDRWGSRPGPVCSSMGRWPRSPVRTFQSHDLDIQRERCLLFIACTRARENLVAPDTGHRACCCRPDCARNG
jgi:hypothetical protein